VTRTVGIRLLFAGTVVLFAAQLVLIAAKTEPYPALIMPGFNGHPLETDVIVVEKPQFRVQFADQQAQVIEYDELLPQTPLDALPIFKNAFPFYDFAIDHETLMWLQSNVAERFPGRTPSGVDVIWRKAAYDLHHSDAATYTTVRTVHLDFVPEQ
jgi:hypothetical protein